MEKTELITERRICMNEPTFFLIISMLHAPYRKRGNTKEEEKRPVIPPHGGSRCHSGEVSLFPTWGFTGVGVCHLHTGVSRAFPTESLFP